MRGLDLITKLNTKYWFKSVYVARYFGTECIVSIYLNGDIEFQDNEEWLYYSK